MKPASAFLTLLLVAVSLSAQNSTPPATGVVPDSTITGGDNVVSYAEFARPRRMVFYFQADPEQFSAFDRTVLYRSVLMAVGSANPNVVLLESPEPEVPATKRGMEEAARRIDADCWLYVSATGGMDNIRIEAETFDILKQQRYGADVIEPGFPLDYRTLAQGFWDNLTETIRTSYGAVYDTLKVSVNALPGTRITGLGPRELDVGASGSAEVTLSNPATYRLRATKPGYYPVERTFYLGYDPLKETLQQERAARFGVDLAINNLQFPEARFWFFPIPSTLYLRAGFTTYALGAYLINSTPSVFRGNPLTRFNAGAGWFFGSPGQNIRIYSGADAFVRVVHGGGVFEIEPYAPFGASITAGVEYSPWTRLRFFAEYAPLLYYTPDAEKFREVSFIDGKSVTGYLFLSSFAIDLRNISIGIRYTW